MTRDELLAPGAGLELLLDIRLDGIATGYATAMFMIAVASGMSQDEAERYADDEADRALLAIKRDPLAMEEQRREVRERLAGVDSGPRMIALYRRYAEYNLAQAQAVLAAPDDAFRVYTHTGTSIQRHIEVLQEGSES